MKKICFTFILSISLTFIYGQGTYYNYGVSYILDNTIPGYISHEYTASEYVKMIAYEQNGFESSPEPGQYFHAKTDPLMVVPPGEGEFGGPNPGDYGVVGTLPGHLSVSPTGAAIYTIPIDLPPGIGGMTPQLNLVYNSQAGNGIMGLGWSLSGLSSISRVGTNIYHEGFVDGVDFDSNDKLALDGNRLIPDQVIDNVFWTEIETASKIVRHLLTGTNNF